MKQDSEVQMRTKDHESASVGVSPAQAREKDWEVDRSVGNPDKLRFMVRTGDGAKYAVYVTDAEALELARQLQALAASPGIADDVAREVDAAITLLMDMNPTFNSLGYEALARLKRVMQMLKSAPGIATPSEKERE